MRIVRYLPKYKVILECPRGLNYTVSMGHPQKILVRTPNWIGDHVMAMPFYRGLRHYYSDSEIVFLTVAGLAGQAGLDDSALCDRKLILSDKARHLGPAFWNEARLLRCESFDLAITLPASFSAAFIAALTGARYRVGFFADANALFLTSGLRWAGRDAGKHKSTLYLELLEFLIGHDIDHETFDGKTPLHSSPGSSAKIEKRIVVAPGASIPLREWPYFEVLLKQMSNAFPDYVLAIVGSQRELAWSDRVKALALPRFEDWIGKTNLSQLVTLCKESELVIANDSGVAHIAASLAGASTLVLYGPGDPAYIRPLGPSVLGLRVKELACSPCEKPYCRAPYGDKTCLNSMNPEWVLGKVKELLATKALSL